MRSMAFTRDLDLLSAGLSHENSAVRYWAAIGLGNLRANSKDLGITDKPNNMRDDPLPIVRIATARYFCLTQRVNDGLEILKDELNNQDEWVRLSAAQVLDEIGDDARPAIEGLKGVMNDENQYVSMSQIMHSIN